jgi:hypothetical protein
MRHDKEQELLAAFRAISDEIDLDYIISITKKRAAAQPVKKPILRLVTGSLAADEGNLRRLFR